MDIAFGAVAVVITCLLTLGPERHTPLRWRLMYPRPVIGEPPTEDARYGARTVVARRVKKRAAKNVGHQRGLNRVVTRL